MPECSTPESAQSTKSPQHVRNTVPSVGISYIWHPFRERLGKRQNAGNQNMHDSHKGWEGFINMSIIRVEVTLLSADGKAICHFSLHYCKQICRRTGAFTFVPRISIHTGSVPQQSSRAGIQWPITSSRLKPDSPSRSSGAK